VGLVANVLKRPFYVAVESYKFARMYPLSQRDTWKLSQSSSTHPNRGGDAASSDVCNANISVQNVALPTVDFTPSKYITLMFTDVGVLTPAAVSDELIRMYQ
jgi:translation initiation factor eIF-2B subunit alpha